MPRRIIVVAIDIGTTFSSCSFSYLYEYEKNPLNVSSLIWTTGYDNTISTRTQTSILFDSEENFDSFGYEAEKRYLELTEDGEHHDWHYFRRFKQMLLNECLSKQSVLEDQEGRSIEAMKVFSSAIGYLKDNFLGQLQEKVTSVTESDIDWVITVPAFWNNSSIQFMTEAAEKVGICGEKLLIVTEPEAASMYCMHQPIQMESENCSFRVFEPGTKHMVVIAEDWTVEMTVFEVQHNGDLKELYKANGGDWGGSMVDASFLCLLTDVVGNDVMKKFSSKYKDDSIDLLNNFHFGRKRIRPDLDHKVTVTLPTTLLETSKMNLEMDINSIIESKPKYKNQLTLVANKLRMESKIAKAFFEKSSNKIIYHMQELFSYPTLKDVSRILLVGHFTESPMLQCAIRKAFSDKNVIVPEAARFAVPDGAVLCGHLKSKLKHLEQEESDF